MVQWLAVVCMVILATCLWTILRYLRAGSPSTAWLPGMGRDISRCRATDCWSNPCLSDHNSDDAPTEGADSVTLICKPSALASHLVKNCPTFSTFDFGSRWSWRASPFLQTVFGACWPSDGGVRFVRDHLQMSDDGLVALDWAVAGTAAMGHKRRRTTSNSTNPVLLIIPNSFGKITRNVLKLCEAGLGHGYLPVVFNRRGQNGTPLGTPRLQQFGDPADLREAVCYVRYRHPASRLYAASESTGSGLLLSYLGECGSSSYLTAAACISPVLRCQAWYESAPCWPYGWALLLYQKICLSRYRTALGEVLPADRLFSSSSLRGLEEALFCGPAGGGAGWEAYWERNEPLRDVDEVAAPVLCVCSRDDPLTGGGATGTPPLELFQSNPHLFLLLSAGGGHCGFAAPGGAWSHRALLQFFRAATDFCAGEERARLAPPPRRRGPGGGASGRAFRHRSASTCRRPAACPPAVRAVPCWQRSYTR
ncbi:protein ABHD15-like [Anguilla anguilla]|uniref:protein ABHD15-like n=1 Tax=Anguilla anguilla TaxID=7936 RepID=UPI0015A912EE|nr:protein ABHD15-like [Anguilla anguilla]